MDVTTLTPIAGRSIDKSIEIASISKIMTCYLSLLICRKYNIDMYTHQMRVSDKAAETPGTTAELQSGDLLTVHDLMLGLMLPSGNDASVALAEGLGKVIQRYKQKETKKTPYETFIAHMNLLAREMGLEQSWNNSSGLSSSPNFSTPQAIAILAAVAVRDPTFSQIVNTKKHEV
jgi:serine-type D-Ala-D-Ala carboxypeptidase (penicillin-binding protein 5/6)